MKSIEELKALREQARQGMNIRDDKHEGVRIVVGMATCGIAAGARPVLSAFVEEIAKEKLDVQVSQTGCVGVCQYEPVAEVNDPQKGKITYIKLTPEKAVAIVHKHLIGGEVVQEYTIGAIGK